LDSQLIVYTRKNVTNDIPKKKSIKVNLSE
jgi:hypothetical protein